MIMRWRNVAQALSESMAAPNGYVAGGSGNYIPPDGVLSPAETYVAPTVLPPTRSTLMQKVTALIQDSQSTATVPVVTPAAPVSTSPIQQFLQKAVASIQNVQPQPVDTVAPVTTTQTLWDKVTTMITASAPEVVANVAPKISAPVVQEPALQPVSAPALDYGVVYYNTPVPSTSSKTITPTVYTDPGLDSVVKPVIFQSTAVPSATYQDPLISSSAGTELAKTEPLPATNKSGMVLLGIGALGLLLLLVKK